MLCPRVGARSVTSSPLKAANLLFAWEATAWHSSGIRVSRRSASSELGWAPPRHLSAPPGPCLEPQVLSSCSPGSRETPAHLSASPSLRFLVSDLV